MAAAVAPVFAATPKTVAASLTAACGATDYGTSAPTNAVSVYTAGSNGAYLRRIKAKNRGTASPAQNTVRVFLVISGNYHPILDINMPSGSTPTATVQSVDSDWYTLDLNVPAGAILAVAETVANAVAVTLEVNDY